MSCQERVGGTKRGFGRVCGLSARNTVHTKPRQFGYHTYVAPVPDVKEPSPYCLRLQTIRNAAAGEGRSVALIDLIQLLIEEAE
jgi:hypothetical protein